MEKKNNKKKSTFWTSKKVDEWMKEYGNGIIHKDSPWLDGQIGVKKSDILFEYTPEEISEITKCAKDIVYFANNYCYCLHGTQGYKPIVLRDYQEDMLRTYDGNRFSICVASRQIGKCSIINKLRLSKMKKNFHKYIEDLYFDNKKNIFSKLKSILMKVYRKL